MKSLSLKHATSSFTFPDVIKPQLQLWLDALFLTWRNYYELKKKPVSRAITPALNTPIMDNTNTMDLSVSQAPTSASQRRRSFSLVVDRSLANHHDQHISTFSSLDDEKEDFRNSLSLNRSLGMTSTSLENSMLFSSLSHHASTPSLHVGTAWNDTALPLTSIPLDVERFFLHSGSSSTSTTTSTTLATCLALESTVLQACVYLVTTMTPSLDLELRAQLSHSLVMLAKCFQLKTYPSSWMESLLYSSQTNLPLYMHLLFSQIATAFASFAVAWVHGLTCFLDSTDHQVVTVCLKAIQHLVVQNETYFEYLDLQTIVYHLLFRLNGGHSTMETLNENEHRINFLQIFLAWCPLIQSRIPEFLEKLVATLFALKVKTSNEAQLICKIFSSIAPSCPDFYLWILNQVQPEDDDRLDLVHWSTYHLCPNASYPLLLDAMVTSPHSYVRYGAALILTAYFAHHPEQCLQHAELLTLGIFDLSSPVSMLYRTLMKEAKLTLTSLVETSAPPLITFEKMAAGVRHLVSLRAQLSWIQWMQAWAPTLRSFPPFVFQVMLSLLNYDPLKFQALKCLASMSKILSGMGASQIQLLWQTVEPCFSMYPELWPHFSKLPHFHLTLFQCLILGSTRDRYHIYQFVKLHLTTTSSTLSSTANPNFKLSLLVWLLGLGDTSFSNVTYVIELLQDHLPPLFKPHLNQFQHVLQHPFKLILEYDHLSQVLMDEQFLEEYLQPLYEPYLDFIWTTLFPAEVAFPNPNEYRYQPLLRLSPFWLTFLLHRMKAKPPPLNALEHELRHQPPLPQAGNAVKRRFYMDYLNILLPYLGYPDSYIRVQACHTLFLACFSQTILNPEVTKTLMDCFHSMLSQKGWNYLASLFDLVTYFLRAKVPWVSQNLVHQFLGSACEQALMNPFTPVRLSCLQFLMACSLIFPQAMSTKYSELVTTLKPLLVDQDPLVQATAKLAWMCFCHGCSEGNSLDLAFMIRDTLADVTSGGMALTSDPFLQPLSMLERSNLVQTLMESLGYLHCAVDQITPICFGFLTHALPPYREKSVKTLMRQLPHLGALEKHVVLWMTLPLCADIYPFVCEAANKDAMDVPFLFRISPHTDDATVLPNTPLETLFKTLVSVPLVNRTEALMSFNVALYPSFFPKPSFNGSLQERLNQLPALAKAIGAVPHVYMDQVLYYYEKAIHLPALKPSGYHAMALFAIEHDASLTSITRTLVQAAIQPCPHAMASLLYLCQQSVIGAQTSLTWLKEVLTKGHDRFMELPLGAVQCFRDLSSFVLDLGLEKEWVDLSYYALTESTAVTRGFAFEAKLLLVEWLVSLISLDRVSSLLDVLTWMVTRDSKAFFYMQQLQHRFPDLNPHHPAFLLLQKEVTTKAFDLHPTVRSFVVQLLHSLPMTSPYTEILLADEHPEVQRFLEQPLTHVYPNSVPDPMSAPQFLLNLIVQQEKGGSMEVIHHLFQVYRNLTQVYPSALSLILPLFQEYIKKTDQLRFLLLRHFKTMLDTQKSNSMTLVTPFLQEQHDLLQGCILITSYLITFLTDPEILLQVVTENVHRGLRSQAVHTLFTLKLPLEHTSTYVPRLLHVLHQPEVYEKKVDVVRLLMHWLPFEEKLKCMVPLLEHPNPQLRLVAIQALKTVPVNDLHSILNDIAQLMVSKTYSQKLELEELMVYILSSKTKNKKDEQKEAKENEEQQQQTQHSS